MKSYDLAVTVFWKKIFRPREKDAEKSSPYKVFTREFDVEKTGKQLTEDLPKEEKRAWKQELEVYDALTRPFRNKLDFYDLGKQTRSEPFPQASDTIASILIDHSGSLKGLPAMMSCFLVECLADYLSGAGVKHEILGFTTSQWKGGYSRLKWRQRNCPRNPGRLNDLLHIVYKSASAPEKRAPFEVRHLLNKPLLKENVDGEALQWAKGRLDKLQAREKVIIAVSDGAPVDDATLLANPGDCLYDHLLETLEQISADPVFRLAGVGIRHDVSSFYPANITVDDLEDIAEKVPDFLRSVFPPLVVPLQR